MTKFTSEDYEMAAKAVGIVLDFTIRGDFPPYYVNERGGHSSWNPPDDDGETLRLAVKLRMDLSLWPTWVQVKAGPAYAEEPAEFDRGAATRHAVFRVAIAVGRAMP